MSYDPELSEPRDLAVRTQVALEIVDGLTTAIEERHGRGEHFDQATQADEHLRALFDLLRPRD